VSCDILQKDEGKISQTSALVDPKLDKTPFQKCSVCRDAIGFSRV
jgi:hypothetical protein